MPKTFSNLYQMKWAVKETLEYLHFTSKLLMIIRDRDCCVCVHPADCRWVELTWGIRRSIDNDERRDSFLMPGRCKGQWKYVAAAGACIDGSHGTRVTHAMFGLPAGTAVFSRPCSLLRLMSAGCFPWSLCQATGLKIPREPKPVDGRLWSR